MLKVSVIIPTLNEEAQVADCIKSAQEAGAEEIIVVDAGSTDATAEIAASNAMLLVSPPGRAAQQNVGAENATGEVLLFLHADCRLPADAIIAITESLTSEPDMVAGCFHQRIDLPGFKYKLLVQGNALRVKMLKWAYGDQGIFVRTSTFREIGGFPDVNFLEDLLIMKILKRKGAIRILPNKLLVSARRWESCGVLRQTVRNFTLVAASQLGISPNRLASFYPNER